MKKCFAMLQVILSCCTAYGQSTLNRNANLSYQVLEDNRLQFRVFAPNAKDVKLAGWDIMSYTGNTRSGDKPFPGIPLQKDSSGVWSVTLYNMLPQPYQYFFWIDGVRTLDPANKKVLTTYNQPFSVAEVRSSTGPAFWEMTNVPHGMVHHLSYHSPVLKMDRPVVVYTPPGYEQGKESYPVLYLLHGAGEVSSSWVDAGKANNIADNLIAAGKARPCIIVMPFGHPDGFSGRADSSLLDRNNRFGWMEKEMLQVLIPLTEKSFRVKPGKENRAIAGLSMGGAQTTHIGLRNTDKFSYVGIFSAGDRNLTRNQASFLSAPDKANKDLRLLYIGCGDYDRVGADPTDSTSGIFNNSKKMVEELQARKINHQFRILPKTDHTWYAWRQFLNDDFLPALWK